jgi:hypothetical protein
MGKFPATENGQCRPHKKGGTAMSANEYVQFVLEVKKETSMIQSFDETAAYEVAQLLSGSFIYVFVK